MSFADFHAILLNFSQSSWKQHALKLSNRGTEAPAAALIENSCIGSMDAKVRTEAERSCPETVHTEPPRQGMEAGQARSTCFCKRVLNFRCIAGAWTGHSLRSLPYAEWES